MTDVEAVIEGKKGYMTFVYGDPVIEYRDKVWEELTCISATRTGAWFMCGDFNEIINKNEKTWRPETSGIFFPTVQEHDT